ncbi:MAG TPA: tetraacyldisaccharide 4'-kinase [Burkholderiales bacterium]|nr:tetraacyldisaccharide 4'-kinase [Burkholderiales bacterium]
MGLERHWQRVTPLSALLYPLSVLFRLVVAVRRAAYSRRWLKSERVRVPVVIVGNITVGGTGKTPLVLWLTRFLADHGLTPGIVSRGYGASLHEPVAVTPASDPGRVGDEPVLLAQRSGCPVWVGRDRAGAARALLEAHPRCDVVVSDDGLQHYRLERDVELAVIDGTRALGNGFMLPAGPLREPSSRLRKVDAIVVNGGERAADPAKRAYGLKLEGRVFHNLMNPHHAAGAEHFQGKRVHAIAGIGNPQRFFDHLDALGLEFTAHPFPDHHAYAPGDIAFGNCDAVVMTEKDAVKCARFPNENQWVLRVEAVPDPGLGELVLRKLKKDVTS